MLNWIKLKEVRLVRLVYTQSFMLLGALVMQLQPAVRVLSGVRLCDPTDCIPAGSSVHRILPARILEWAAILSPGDFSDPGMEPTSPVLQVDPLPAEPSGKPPSSASVQFSSVVQLCPTLCDHMNRSTPGLPVHHQLLEFTQTHVHQVSDAIQPSHPLSSPFPPAPNPSQHQSLFQ